MAGVLASVGEELQGRIRLVPALLLDGRLNLMRVRAANIRQLGRVGRVAGRPSAFARDIGHFHGWGTYPITDRRQAGVWPAETMLVRATKARATADFLKNMA